MLSKADPSLFIYHKNSAQIFILLYVNDILITGGHESEVLSIIQQLSDQFSIKNLILASTFLGI